MSERKGLPDYERGYNDGYSDVIIAIVRCWSAYFKDDEFDDLKEKVVSAAELAIRVEKSDRGRQR